MAKTETNVNNLKINTGTYANIQSNLSSIGENELIITDDKNIPIPTSSDSGKVVSVDSNGEFALTTPASGVTITTTSGSESISDGTNTLNFGANAFTNTTIPTSINGLSGGTLTSPLSISGGDATTASKLSLDNTHSGQITDSSTSTLFGFLSNNATTLTVGGNGYALNLRGSGTRPQYKGNNLALYSDVPTMPSTTTAGQLVKTTSTSGSFTSGNSLPYLTTAPSAANTDGGLILVVLSSEPATRYSGYLYIITSSNS